MLAPAQAADLSLLADHWGYRVHGVVVRDGDVQDLGADLGVQSLEHAAYGFAWNTGSGWWHPDFAASYTKIDAAGERRTDNSVSFGPLVLFPAEGVAQGRADLDDVDLTLRYPLQLDALTLWGGLTLKRLRGDVSVRSATNGSEDREHIDQIFPLLHVAANQRLADWVSLSAQGNAVRYGDDLAYEWRVGASLGLLGPLGVNFGWQTKRYRFNDGNYRLDATLSGLIAGVSLTLR